MSSLLTRRSLLRRSALAAPALLLVRPAFARAILPIRSNPLAYPGRAPRFDPSHFAAKGCRWSVVSTGASAVNLCKPSPHPTAQVSAPTSVIDGSLGRASKFTGVLNNGLTFTGGSNAGTDLVLTYACIYRPSNLSSNFTIVANSTTVNSGSLIGYNPTFPGLGLAFLNSFPVVAGITLVAGVPYFIICSGSGVSGGTWNTNWLVLRFDTGQIITAVASGTGQAMVASNGNMVFGGAPSPDGAQDATGNLAAAMYSGGPGGFVMSIPQMLQWAQEPWAFWYPRTLDLASMLQAPQGGPPPSGARLRTLLGVGQ